jgi:hypothetical protein
VSRSTGHLELFAAAEGHSGSQTRSPSILFAQAGALADENRRRKKGEEILAVEALRTDASSDSHFCRTDVTRVKNLAAGF